MKALDDTPAVRVEDLNNVELPANEILQLCCQVDVQLLCRNELQDETIRNNENCNCQELHPPRKTDPSIYYIKRSENGRGMFPQIHITSNIGFFAL